MFGDWYICTTNEPGQVKMIKLILEQNIDKTTANQNISLLSGGPWLLVTLNEVVILFQEKHSIIALFFKKRKRHKRPITDLGPQTS